MCVGGGGGRTRIIYICTYVPDVVCVTGNDACNNIPVFRLCVHFAELTNEAFEQLTCAYGCALVSAHAHTTMFGG